MLYVACEDFATLEDVCFLGCDAGIATGEGWARILDAASDMMSILSGTVITGVCSATLTACRECFCSCGSCRLCFRDPIFLAYPVQAIEGVWVNDVALASSEYRVERRRELVRLDDEGGRICWPSGETRITYSFGAEVDEITRLATAELAWDIAKGMAGGKCSIPKNVSSMTMNGVSITKRELADIVREAGTDLPRVAAWMSVFNPENARGRTLIYSPEAYGDWEYTV